MFPVSLVGIGEPGFFKIERTGCDKAMTRIHIPKHMASLRRSLTLITVAGCLCMGFVAGTTSPAFVEFMRAIGARDVHFGIIGGIPLIMLSMQFLGAVISNAVPKRKTLFMALVISGRFLYAPMALIPVLFPTLRGNAAVLFAILLLAVAGALLNVTGPLWLSWMADLIPRRILNTYWGRRQRWMYVTWTASFVAVAMITFFSGVPITVSFPAMAVVGVIAGIVDIVLFLWIREPPNTVTHGDPVLASLSAPLRCREYRPFVVYSCAWSATAMFAAAFIQVFTLEKLGLTVWQTTLIWCATGIGIASSSAFWGKMADLYGHRPVLAVCMGLKSFIVITFLMVTRHSALWFLPIMLLIDSIWDSGLLVATNGYMLKIAPQRNRPMFIAAITGLAGVCGGLGAIIGGVFLEVTRGFSAHALGRSWGNYHLLFSVNIIMRLVCVWLAFRIREPNASSPEKLLHVLRGAWPMRFLMFPVGLYRRIGK